MTTRSLSSPALIRAVLASCAAVALVFALGSPRPATADGTATKTEEGAAAAEAAVEEQVTEEKAAEEDAAKENATEEKAAEEAVAEEDETPPVFTEEYLADATHIEEGREYWGELCVHCHGAKAYPGKAPKLKPARYKPDFVYDRITNGFRKMPSWKDDFTREERMALVAWVLSREFTP